MKQVKLKAKFTNAADQGGGWHFLIIEPKKVEKLGFKTYTQQAQIELRENDVERQHAHA